MKVILTDDEPFALNYLEKLCLQIPDLEIIGRFGDAVQLLRFLAEQDAELVLLDIEMPGISGIEAVREIRRLRPDIMAIFVTSYEQYALQAFQLEAVSYIMKPCSLQELQSAVRKASKLSTHLKNRVEIKTFGSFNVWIDQIPFRFANSKAKELLALLVDREGGVVAMEQAVDVLWEDRAYDAMVKRLYRKAVSYLNKLCEEKGLDFFVSDRGSCHIIPGKLDCDYFDLLHHSADAARRYNGEYMLDYSWAEPTNGKIGKFLKK